MKQAISAEIEKAAITLTDVAIGDARFELTISNVNGRLLVSFYPVEADAAGGVDRLVAPIIQQVIGQDGVMTFERRYTVREPGIAGPAASKQVREFLQERDDGVRFWDEHKPYQVVGRKQVSLDLGLVRKDNK